MRPLKRNRPTVGVLAGWQVFEERLPHGYLVSVFKGLYAAAHDWNCNLIFACGMAHAIGVGDVKPAWPVISADSDFLPVGPWNTDGLVMLAPAVTTQRSLYLQELRAAGYPVVYVSAGEAGPSVIADNFGGVRNALIHLKEHGHRHIAFLAFKPDAVGDGLERLEAYRSVVRELGLDPIPGLLAWGGHNSYQGRSATRALIESGIEFSALLASNDESAYGAMQALRDAGRHIPSDVAVVGFDDRPMSVAQVPSLTSVRYPMFESGYQALGLLLEHFSGTAQGERVIRLPMPLVVRQSCGCQPGVEPVPAFGMDGRSASASQARTFADVRHELIATMADASHTDNRQLPVGDVRGLCQELVEALVHSIRSGTPTRFQQALRDALLRVEAVDDDPHAWQSVISAMRSALPVLMDVIGAAPSNEPVEDWLHQARVVISESVDRRNQRHRFSEDRVSDNAALLTARLLAALDEAQIVHVLDELLPSVGVAHARVVLFEPDGDDPVAWSAPQSGSSAATRLERSRSREFPPPELVGDQPFRLALVPLVFQDEAQQGFVAFEAGNLDACGAITRQVAAAFKSARLHAQVRELSLTDGLTGLPNLRYLDLFLRQEAERSRRYDRDLAMVMFDLDHFKKYNDTFGHPAGNVALQQVAICLSHARRGVDLAARFGGEEFALVLPETDAAGAVAVAEKIRAAVANLPVERRLTLSAGVAVAHGEACDAKTLLEQADRALYQAKQAGRDRTVTGS